MSQVRVSCTAHSVDARVRLRHEGRLLEFALHLQPLAQEIVPEDTVSRLRGKSERRRLELLLFPREKERLWYGELLSDKARPKAQLTTATSQPQPTALPPPLLACSPLESKALPHWVEHSQVAETERRTTLAVRLA